MIQTINGMPQAFDPFDNKKALIEVNQSGLPPLSFVPERDNAGVPLVCRERKPLAIYRYVL
jgi:hypothetical protein